MLGYLTVVLNISYISFPFFGYLELKCSCCSPPSNCGEMGLVHAQHGVVLQQSLPACLPAVLVCHCVWVLWLALQHAAFAGQTNGKLRSCLSLLLGFWLKGEAATLCCVDCQLTCHMLEILDGTRTGQSRLAALAAAAVARHFAKLSFGRPQNSDLFA